MGAESQGFDGAVRCPQYPPSFLSLLLLCIPRVTVPFGELMSRDKSVLTFQLCRPNNQSPSCVRAAMLFRMFQKRSSFPSLSYSLNGFLRCPTCTILTGGEGNRS